MAADTLKSLSITNLDLQQVQYPNTGVGASGYLKSTSDFVTPTAGGLASTASIYKVLRVPTNAKVKSVIMNQDVKLDTNAAPTLSWDIGLYYSDSQFDQTPPALQGTLISANLFAAAQLVPLATGSIPLNDTAVDNAFTVQMRNQPLWQAAGLTADPGGFFDIVAAVHAVAATANAAGNLGLEVRFVE